ncbi:DHA2 family efflux MFS transporter permease subunit [Aeromicrobium sp. CF4.19]|uniref:DHA2 family efflux MFS transporter permease subunit n=1 Tax=Aeromicrobium sp. CF4.19 TaxID=3373082 RepID=UPI003EE59829
MSDVTLQDQNPTPGRPPAPAARLSREHALVIGVLLVSSFVVILNETVMSVAIPVLQDELGVPPSTGQWLTTAFLLTMGVVIPLTGFLIQRIPTRLLYVMAMSLFTAGTVLAFMAPGFGTLLVARVVQASGTAIMLPLLMTTIMTVVPASRRGVMMGNVSIVIAVAPALGPTLSGFILDQFGWRWIFGLVAPIALIALLVGARHVVSVAAATDARIDLLSVPLALLGFGGLVYALVSVGESAQAGAEAHVPLWLPVIVGGVAMVSFVLRQVALQKRDRALLDLRVFGSGQFTLAMVSLVLGMMTLFGTFILIPYFAQQVLDYSPLKTGLLSLPGGLLMGLAGPVVGRIYDAKGARVLVLPGTLLVSAGIWSLTLIDADTTMTQLVLANMAIFLGLAATFTPLMTSGLGSVPERLYSHGSAVVGTFQQVAGAAGTALLVTVMTVVAARTVDGGATEAQGVAEGVRTAFTIAGVLSLLLIATAVWVRKPAEVTETP